MPLPSDEKLIALAQDLLHQFDALFGLHPGFRPAHAKGIMFTGVFTPSPEGASLTRAPHVINPSTPVTVRFSNSTGIPVIPDNDPNADPRGMAIRFHLGEHVHTDIVAHSTDGFPTHTPQEFLEFLKAVVATNDPNAPKTSPNPVEIFLGSHPKALEFIQTPKPAPSSFAREAYFGVTAFHFTNQDGKSSYGRYRIVPEAGVDHLDPAALASKTPDFLFEEIEHRICQAPARFKVLVQVAAPEDKADDATIHWPEDRPQVELGALTLKSLASSEDPENKRVIFDPIPRVDGIEPSEDPLLELRAAIYLISGRRRRAADTTASAPAAVGAAAGR
jgi:catalase